MIIDDERYIDRINAEIKQSYPNLDLIENKSSAYFVAEYLVYLFADKIIFTNENQREVMLRQFPVDVYDMVLTKSEIKQHPTLPDKYYHIIESKLKIDNDFINIAYFGNEYYGKRHFESIFLALESLNHKYKNIIRLYLFNEDQLLLKRLISTLSVKNNIIIKKPVDYLEFLNLTTKFDVLVVNDLITKGNYDINPYLPSKFSDYLGSKSNIWAICEDGSSLSRSKVKYKSYVDDYKGSSLELVRILEDNGFEDEDFSIEDIYMQRLTSLNELYEKEFRNNVKLKKQLKEAKSKKGLFKWLK